MTRNLFTPSNVRPGLLNTIPSLPRWTILPPSPSTSSVASPTPCPKQRQKRLKKKGRGMKVIPPTPEPSSDQEIDELEDSPYLPAVQPPPPPPSKPSRKKKSSVPTTIPTAQNIPATQDEPFDVQGTFYKLFGLSKLVATEDQKEFIELVSNMEAKDALKFILLLMMDNQSGPSRSDRSDSVDSRPLEVSRDTKKNIYQIVKRRLRSGETGTRYEKPDYAHVISELKQDDERGGLPEDWDLSAEQITAVSRCTDACTTKVKADMRRQVKIAKQENKPTEKLLRSVFGIQENGFGKKQKGFASVMRSEYHEGVNARSYWQAVDGRLQEYYSIKSRQARTEWLEEQIADDEEFYPEPAPGTTKRKRNSNNTDSRQRRKKQRSKAPSEEL